MACLLWYAIAAGMGIGSAEAAVRGYSRWQADYSSHSVSRSQETQSALAVGDSFGTELEFGLDLAALSQSQTVSQFQFWVRGVARKLFLSPKHLDYGQNLFLPEVGAGFRQHWGRWSLEVGSFYDSINILQIFSPLHMASGVVQSARAGSRAEFLLIHSVRRSFYLSAEAGWIFPSTYDETGGHCLYGYSGAFGLKFEAGNRSRWSIAVAYGRERLVLDAGSQEASVIRGVFSWYWGAKPKPSEPDS